MRQPEQQPIHGQSWHNQANAARLSPDLVFGRDLPQFYLGETAHSDQQPSHPRCYRYVKAPLLLHYPKLFGDRDVNSYQKGDQLIYVNIWTPQELTKEEKEILSSIKDSESFKPNPGKNDKSFFERMKEFF